MLLLPTLFLLPSVTGQQQPPAATKTAIGAPADLPRGSFEKTNITTQQYNPAWAGWTFSPLFTSGGANPIVGGSGIAKNGAPLLAQSNPTPHGGFVAFVHGVGTVSTSVTFQPGTWRLRFSAAQRLQGTTPNVQALRVDIGADTVLQQLIPDGVFTDYVTEPIRITAATTLQVSFVGQVGQGSNNIAMIDKVMLDRVLPWSSTATWGGSVPTAADNVRVPPLTAVAMDGACVAATVQVEGSLRADAVNASLTSRWVLVRFAGSSFVVGTEQAPFQQQFTLTLTGLPTTEDVLGAGTKFLMAMNGGRIDMHGQPRVSWTKLASVNGSTIRLVDAIDWQPNDEVVVAPSRCMSSVGCQTPFSEVRSIVAVASPTGDVILNQAFAHGNIHHAGAPVSYSNGTRTWLLDQRAEVGLLTHNVKIEGDQATSSSNRFGAHVMIMNGSCCVTPGFGRFSNVQMTRMGQKSPSLPLASALGRYPMHWHMQIDNGLGQYLKNSSIRESFNRAVTIHGSNYVIVERNVCYDHVGHGIFLEDGVEQHNSILGNLVLGTKKPPASEALLSHDAFPTQPQNRAPAAFWISHPNNTFIGNVAADTVGTGYWFALHQSPTGLSATEPAFNGIDATKAPLGTFTDNVSHSLGSGIDLNDSVHAMGTQTPLDDQLATNVAWDPVNPVVISGFVAYSCATALYAGAGLDKVTFDDCVMADNEWHVQFACAFTATNSLLVENTLQSLFTPCHPSFSGVAYLTYDGPGRLTDSHLVGFDGTRSPNATVVSSVFGASQRHTNHELSGLTFVGTPLIQFDDFANLPPPPPPTVPTPHDSRHWGIAVANLDGTVSGLSGYTLVTNHPMMHLGTAPNGPDLVAGTNAFWSPYQWGYLRILHYRSNGAQLLPTEQPDMTFTRWDHQGWLGASFLSNFQVDAHRQMPLIVRRAAGQPTDECWYTVAWAPPTIAKSMRIVMDDMASGDVTRLHLLNQNGWSGEQVLVNGSVLAPVDNPQDLDGLGATAYARTHGQSLWLRMVNTGKTHVVVITWP
jgi:hypothetical protein